MNPLSPKAPAEKVPVTFDFSDQLADGELIVSGSVTVEARAVFGYDASPSSRLAGSPAVDSGVVQQLFDGGVLGEHYVLTCTAPTNNSQRLVLVALLPVRDPADT